VKLALNNNPVSRVPADPLIFTPVLSRRCPVQSRLRPSGHGRHFDRPAPIAFEKDRVEDKRNTQSRFVILCRSPIRVNDKLAANFISPVDRWVALIAWLSTIVLPGPFLYLNYFECMAYVRKFFLTQAQAFSASLALLATPKQIQGKCTDTILQTSSISPLRRYRHITIELGAPTDVHAGRIGSWKTVFVLYGFAEASSSFSDTGKRKA
jgi:hypothetical protein